jgi:hypothetical protein
MPCPSGKPYSLFSNRIDSNLIQTLVLNKFMLKRIQLRKAQGSTNNECLRTISELGKAQKSLLGGLESANTLTRDRHGFVDPTSVIHYPNL